MPECQAYGCVNRRGEEGAGKGKRYFVIPDGKKNPEKRELSQRWLNNIGTGHSVEKFTFGKHKVVCEDHFRPECFEEDIRARLMGETPRKILKPDAVPEIFVRVLKRSFKKDVASLLEPPKEWMDRPTPSTSSMPPPSKMKITEQSILSRQMIPDVPSLLEPPKERSDRPTPSTSLMPPPSKRKSTEQSVLSHQMMPTHITSTSCEVGTQTDRSLQCLLDAEVQTSGPDVMVNIEALKKDHTYAEPSLLVRESVPQVVPSPPDIESTDTTIFDMPSTSGCEHEVGYTDDVKDPTYVPDYHDDDDDDEESDNMTQEFPEESPFPKRVVDDDKFIVFGSCLDKLFYKIKCEECYCNVETIRKGVVGTGLFVTMTCISGHERQYLVPEVNSAWVKDQSLLISSLKGKSLSIVGDGRCDSPGYSAKYCSYTLMDIETEKVVDFELVQVSETGSSVKMEAVGFDRCFSRVLNDHKLETEKFASDRHVSIRKLMKDNYKGVKHNFDVFHLAKNISSKLRKIAKKKGNEDIECWIKSINNHVRWCSRNCGKDPSKLIEMWMSLSHHITGNHSWHDDERFVTFKECSHQPIDPEINRRKKWLVEGSAAHSALNKIILNKRLLNDLKYIAEFMHTGALEVYHNVVLKYAPKRLEFDFP
ncbi:hypothetical protein HOLleu_02957 [Holothuria leucospilota]|uniref:THAP-type domain-containing protein n=1 Tax=Holothuria leucospilota TaxID=206669 RepID=A0A9Q1CT35_HOLLE|nr:hypothetical protein HOLleu_02957 [Holothuria leucospilota]